MDIGISKGVLEHDVIVLDDLTEMMFQHMKRVMADEPPLPGEDHDRFEHEEMAAAHYEWSRQRDAVRILLGVQLVNLGLAQL